MKRIHFDPKKGELKAEIENRDDLWHLGQLIDPGDRVKGKTLRKIKLGEKDQRTMNVIKKPVFMELAVEKSDLNDSADQLRISGTVLEGPEDVPKGAHHTFTVEEHSIFTLVKEKWLSFQLEKLKEALEVKGPAILICILDREEAFFALTKQHGHDILSQLKGNVQKKDDHDFRENTFYREIGKMLEEYDQRYAPQHIVLASPAFWKEDLSESLKNESLKKKITLATCSSVDPGAVNEVLKRPEVKSILEKDRVAREMEQVDGLLAEIAKDRNAAYGIKETKLAAEAGAVKVLLVTDNFIQKARQEKRYEELDAIMKVVDRMKGEIHLIGSGHDGGRKLDGLGGIGAILRYKLNFS